MMGNYHARCGAGEKPEVETPEAYLSLFGQIPNFDKLIATIRSREISASIILQSQSQLKAIYKDAAEIISDNCDCTLFLSGRGKNAKEISDVLGKETIDSYNQSENRGAQTSHGLNYQKLGNLITLADFYGVSVDYLLCRTENKEQINTPLTELHLNDEMVELLKSGRINNRLLCELATHKDFIKFLADIEIYVDGIATMQIQNLNALVDTVRHEIIERYRPGEDDPHLKVLQAAHISDDEYFSHMVLDDLNLIIRDIREAHKKDSESAPQTTVANELKENLEAVENFKGSRLEKLAMLYCKQLGINYKNLSEEEFRWLIRILQKSKKMGTPISQRKKR